MELSGLNLAAMAEEGYDLQLTHPVTHEKLDGVVRIRGDKSKVVQAYARKRFNELQKRERVQKGKNQDTSLNIEELEDMNIESAVIRVISWKNIKKDGQELPFTKENATQVFKDYDWIRAQIMEASEELLNFQPE